MVQEMPTSVPEELYNLTQLADVSIAAGKLSTTAQPGEQYHPGYHHHHHHHYPGQYGAIKYYSLQHESPTYHQAQYYQHAIPYHSQLREEDTTDQRHAELHSPSPPPVHQLQSYSATKKKWKTNWEINRGLKLQQQQQQQQKISKIRDTEDRTDYDDSFEAASYYTSTIRTVEGVGGAGTIPSRPESSSSSSSSHAATEEQQLPRRNSFASEESEDSSYSYSHKVFDRKKSRTLSWNSGSSYSHGDDGRRLSGERELSQEGCRFECGTDGRECAELTEASGRGGSSGDEVGSADDVHGCPECGKKYSTSSNLARHRQTHRSLQDKKARRCPHCSKVYVSMPAYSMHVRTHNQGCQCPTCGKCFSRPWLLQGHIRTHTGEKPFKCSVCQKAFADKSNLRAHVQTHSNTKPHSCTRCGKAFALKSYLYKHEDSSCMKNKTGKHPKQGGHSKARRKADRDHSTSSSLEGHPFAAGYARHQQQPSSPLDLALQTELQLKKDAVRAKIREVLEDNCKKSAQLKAATDNRISVIRTTASTHEVYYSRQDEIQLAATRDTIQAALGPESSSSSGYEYPRNYAIIA